MPPITPPLANGATLSVRPYSITFQSHCYWCAFGMVMLADPGASL